MPFHVRCSQCQHMIAKGVRFNAVKKKAGRYLGTMIFEFVMPCPQCKNTLVIKTDPKNCEYLLVSGCLKYQSDYDESKIETEKMQTPEEGEALNKNPFLKLESQKIDIIKAEEKKTVLKEIIEEKRIYSDDFKINQLMRRQLKIEKIKDKKSEEESKRKGLDIRLLPLNDHDKFVAHSAKFRRLNNKFNLRDSLRLQPIFSNKDGNKKYAKNEEILNLLNKKHRIDRSLQISLEKEKANKTQDSFSNLLKLNVPKSIIVKKTNS